MRAAKCSFFSAEKWPPKPFASVSLHLVSLRQAPELSFRHHLSLLGPFSLSSSLLLFVSSPSEKVDVGQLQPDSSQLMTLGFLTDNSSE